MDTKREHRTHVEGSPRGNPYDLTYSPSGRMTTKYCDNGSVTMVKTVDMAYGYCDNDQPHAVRRMCDHHTHRHFDLRWDPAGNLGQVSATGKELDAETGYSYFGARYYAPTTLAAWLSVDPMSDKYPSISPYAYCAWNPLKLVDPEGEELILKGESENVNKFIKILNSCFSFSSDVFGIVDGKVQSRELTPDEIVSLSTEQQEFYNTVTSAINEGNTISLNVASNRKDVLFGSWESSTIDVADMYALGKGEGLNMYSAIGHEIAEQQYKQTSSNPNFCIGHYRYAMNAEDKISGCFRTSESAFGNTISFDYSRYSDASNIKVNIHLTPDCRVESVGRIKYPINFGR